MGKRESAEEFDEEERESIVYCTTYMQNRGRIDFRRVSTSFESVTRLLVRHDSNGPDRIPHGSTTDLGPYAQGAEEPREETTQSEYL